MTIIPLRFLCFIHLKVFKLFPFSTFAVVWNIKAQEKRLVQLCPRDDWGGKLPLVFGS
jgi:hypothetical protein